jgi:hypothetical protein
MSPENGMGPLPERDVIPVQISDSVTRGEVRPTYPVIEYPHSRDGGGDAIANGFVYGGKLIPLLTGKLVFGDITTGRVWYVNGAEVLAADDDNPTTVAPIYEMDADLRRITEETYRKRGGMGQTLPGIGVIAGRGRVDLRFAQDNDGELYILTKSDGMIRKVVGAKGGTTTPAAANVPARSPGRNDTGAQATTVRNPQVFTAASVAAGRRVFNQLRGLSRKSGARSSQGRHHDLHHRGAARQAATGSH